MPHFSVFTSGICGGDLSQYTHLNFLTRCMDWLISEATEIKLLPNLNWVGKSFSE
jgi:hypothetical protein